MRATSRPHRARGWSQRGTRDGVHSDNPDVVGTALREDGGIVVVRYAGHARLGVGLGTSGEVDRLAPAVEDGLPGVADKRRDASQGRSLRILPE